MVNYFRQNFLRNENDRYKFEFVPNMHFESFRALIWFLFLNFITLLHNILKIELDISLDSLAWEQMESLKQFPYIPWINPLWFLSKTLITGSKFTFIINIRKVATNFDLSSQTLSRSKHFRWCREETRHNDAEQTCQHILFGYILLKLINLTYTRSQ